MLYLFIIIIFKIKLELFRYKSINLTSISGADPLNFKVRGKTVRNCT